MDRGRVIVWVLPKCAFRIRLMAHIVPCLSTLRTRRLTVEGRPRAPSPSSDSMPLHIPYTYVNLMHGAF